MQRSADNRRLTRLETVHLVVRTAGESCSWCTHSLLTHLTLVHVTGRLVEVGEGGHVGEDGEDVSRIELHVGRIPGNDLLLRAGNRHVRLLLRTDKVLLLQRKVLDGTDHTSGLRGHVKTGVRTAVGRRNVTDLELNRNAVLAIDLPVTESLGDRLALLRGTPTDDPAIKHDDHTLAGGSRGDVDNAELESETRDGRGVDRLGHDLALVGQMVEKTARRTIRSVDRAEETPRFGQKLTDRCRLELGEEGTTMHHAEMTDETQEVELLSNDGEAGNLLQIETGGRYEVTGRQEILERLADVLVRPAEDGDREVFGESLGLE